MDQFPRIQLFSAREKRAAAILSAAILTLLLTGVWYLHPTLFAGRRVASVPPVPIPRPQVYLTVASASASTAYVTTFQSPPDARSAFRTDDGGRTWHRLTLPDGPAASFTLAAVPGRESDVVLLTPVEYWLSHDRGTHWIQVSLACCGNSRGFWFPDADHWFSVTNEKDGIHVHESSDEGETWINILTLPGPSPRIDGVPLGTGGINVTYGAGATWLLVTPVLNGVAGDWQLLRSGDNGATWKPVDLPNPEAQRLRRAGISTPSFQSNGQGWITIYATSSDDASGARPHPYLSTTTDGGRTWSPFRTVQYPNYVSLPGSGDWWATHGHVIYRSSDLGKTWSATNPALPAHTQLDAIYRATPLVAWGVYGGFIGGPVSHGSDRPHLLRTADDGRHWSEVSFPGP